LVLYAERRRGQCDGLVASAASECHESVEVSWCRPLRKKNGDGPIHRKSLNLNAVGFFAGEAAANLLIDGDKTVL